MSFPAPTKTYHKTAYSSINPGRLELSAKGKTILITGGGTGIGAATAKAFAQAGASCIGILGRREQPLLDTKTEIETDYPDTKVLAIPTDVAKKDEVDAAFAQIAESGKVDILVSNAAVLGKKSHIANMTAEDVSNVPVRTVYDACTDFVHQHLVPLGHHPQSQRQFQRRADLPEVRITRCCPH
jgi:NAD(P)-dependent dehydrogenase (short-subunit alcohol dehydrogenase family)